MDRNAGCPVITQARFPSKVRMLVSLQPRLDTRDDRKTKKEKLDGAISFTDDDDTSEIECTETGRWRLLKSCHTGACPPPSMAPSSENGATGAEKWNCIPLSGIKEEMRCEKRCQDGYEIKSNTSTIRCWGQGAWLVANESHADATCQKKQCSALPVNATTENRWSCSHGNDYGSVCTLQCADGFYASNAVMRECQTDGSWTDRVGECVERADCPSLPIDQNEIWRCSNGRDLGSRCKKVCRYGFQLENAVDIQCGGGGQWSRDPNTVERCQRVECPPMAMTKDRLVTCDDYQFDSWCTISCPLGYESPRPILTRCLQNASWSVFEDTCRPTSALKATRERDATIGLAFVVILLILVAVILTVIYCKNKSKIDSTILRYVKPGRSVERLEIMDHDQLDNQA